MPFLASGVATRLPAELSSLLAADRSEAVDQAWTRFLDAHNRLLLHVARSDLVYGLLGSFIGLLLWIYYTSIIFLVGAVVALACWRDRPAPTNP